MGKFAAIVLFIFILAGVAYAGWFYLAQNPAPITAPVSIAQELPSVPELKQERRLLDGVLVLPEDSKPTIFALVVDNMIDSRPPSGLSYAALVIEAPAEAGITRFLAFFQSSEDVQKIGPVRSLRPYFLDWAQEIADLIGHVGGSPDALRLAKSATILDLNQFYNDSSFWRDQARSAPFNVYTETSRLTDALTAKSHPERLVSTPWIYKDDAPKEKPGSTDIKIPSIDPIYDAEWKYDAGGNNYQRYVDGKKYHDAEGFVISAKNIAVMMTTIKILDEVGRRKITTVGEGKALVFQDGNVIDGTWKKEEGSRTKFFDVDGKEIAFNAGPTWIEVVANGTKVTY